MKIHYNPKPKQLARRLRNESTLSEILLWEELKNRTMFQSLLWWISFVRQWIGQRMGRNILVSILIVVD